MGMDLGYTVTYLPANGQRIELLPGAVAAAKMLDTAYSWRYLACL